MRFALALCVVVGCAMCGRAMASASRRRAETLAALVRGLRVLRVHMLRMFEPVGQALAATECPPLMKIGRAMGPGVSAWEAWSAASPGECRRGGSIDALTAEDRRILEDVFRQLGESGREQQDILLSAAIALLEQNRESAAAGAKEADRLYLSLGALTGLMIALIVI